MKKCGRCTGGRFASGSNWFAPWVDAGLLGWEDDLYPWTRLSPRFLSGWLNWSTCVPNSVRTGLTPDWLVMGYCCLPSGVISYNGIGFVPPGTRWPFGLTLSPVRPPPP